MKLVECCQREIIDLHRFFEDWFNGRIRQSRQGVQRVHAALAEEFHIVTPDALLMDRHETVERVYGSWGFAKDEPGRLKIDVRSIELRKVTHNDLAILTYEEWHERKGSRRGRLSTALLRPRPSAPCGVEWLHVHEAWIDEVKGPDHVG